MHMTPGADRQLHLLQNVRAAATAAQRRFVLLNQTRDDVPYHAAVLCHPAGGLLGHSGASQVDPHGPYGQWLARLAGSLAGRGPGAVDAADVPADCAAEWPHWWPPHALWLPAAPAGDDAAAAPALLLAREVPWTDAEQNGLQSWADLWRLADRAAAASHAGRGGLFRRGGAGSGWWRGMLAAAALLVAAMLPVKLTVRAPGELVPREPTVMRVGIEGTVRRLRVEPNQFVKAGDVLAELDDATWASRLQTARQALVTAEEEWRQTHQQALNDGRAKIQLAAAQGRLEERQTEVGYLAEQMQRTALLAPHDGVVLVDDPGSWAGRTVSAGEAILRLALPQDQELEAWLPVGDAIDLPEGSPMHLHLSSRPGSPVVARLRLYAYEAERRADGVMAYRLRGALRDGATERLGARGTVRIHGPSVPLAYWVLRRPLAALRETTGW
jgi:hypothetical protein